MWANTQEHGYFTVTLLWLPELAHWNLLWVNPCSDKSLGLPVEIPSTSYPSYSAHDIFCLPEQAVELVACSQLLPSSGHDSLSIPWENCTASTQQMEKQRAPQEKQQNQDTADTKPICSAGILYPGPSQEWRQLGKGCMRCLDRGGTHLWPLWLKQPHAALTASTLRSYHMLLCWEGLRTGQRKFYIVFCKNKNCDLLPTSMTIYTWTVTFMLCSFHPACSMPEKH